MTSSKHDYAHYDQFVTNFDLVYKTIEGVCLCTKFEVIYTNEHRVMGQRSWRIFYYVI